ncbi:bactofilin family protein [Brevibacillus ginsengisoli]|uniref:bactofilin family protein n=1 Tax=Brevibacillus ginsengisoli TaxID=363854 RepID=UPI003CEB127F
MKRWGILLITVLCLFGFTGSAVYAFGSVDQGSFVLSSDATYPGDLFVNAQKAVIDGKVDGDLYVFAESVQINGEVKGDVIAFAANTLVHGKIDGNLRAITQHAIIDGTITRNISSFNQNLLVSPGAHVLGSVMTFAESLDIKGKVNREANGFVNVMRVGGELGQGTSFMRVNNLTIDSTAKINGDLVYSAPARAVIHPGAAVNGQERFTLDQPKEKSSFTFLPVLFLLMSLLSTIMIWLLLRFLFPKALHQIHRQFDGEWTPLFGLGALFIFGVPIISIILLLSIIGIPISLTLFFSLFILFYVSKIFIGTWLGSRIAKRFQWPLHPLMAEFLGVLVVYGVLQIPFLGWLLNLIITMLFLGASATAIRHSNNC